jgi:DNA-binding NarL/FixJ family response regulator
MIEKAVYITGCLAYFLGSRATVRLQGVRPGGPSHILQGDIKPMTDKTKVVIAEDHQLFREGLKAMLTNRDDLDLVGEAADGLEAIRAVQRLRPDLLLLDLSMPRLSGISVMKDVKRQFPEIIILALTIHESDQYVLEAFDAGANVYCIKDASRKELMMAIDSVIAGKTYISPGIADSVMEGYLEGRKRLKEKTSWDTITQREREVLKLLAEGYANKEIAEFLSISVKTVEKHRANIMQKTDLHNASALTAYAIQNGLVSAKQS